MLTNVPYVRTHTHAHILQNVAKHLCSISHNVSASGEMWKYMWLFQEGDDSDSRSQPRQSSSQYYSQVSYLSHYLLSTCTFAYITITECVWMCFDSCLSDISFLFLVNYSLHNTKVILYYEIIRFMLCIEVKSEVSLL